MALDLLRYAVLGGYLPAQDCPATPEGLFLAQELARISQEINEIADMTPQASQTPPNNPREPMIRLAMLPWDPLGGNTVAGQLVIYRGGTWVAL